MALSLSSCTAIDFPIKGLPNDYFKEAKNPREVMEMIDALENPVCDEMLFMEGYGLADLTTLDDWDRLSITRGSNFMALPAMLGVWGFGGAYVEPGFYGDVYSADIYYLADENNFALAHELMHAAGCMEPTGTDLGILRMFNDYAPEQRRLMESEGVDHWTDTTFYRLWSMTEEGRQRASN